MKHLIATALLFIATPAFAHVRLADSTPAADASVKSPGLIRLHFSEALAPALSGATLSDAAGKMMPVSTAVGGTAVTLIAPTLRPGAYIVEWHGVGHDTRRINGRFTFKVIP
jgi:hypothetical protein